MNISRIVPIVLILLLILAAPVGAQDLPETFCGDLSEADCQLLMDSAAAMRALESTTFHLEADMSVDNVPDMPFDALNFHLAGDGSFAADVSALHPEDILSGDVEFFPLMADMLRTVAADMTFTLELPEEVIALAETEEQQIPDTLSFDIRMVDGVAYVNLADLAEIAPEGSVPPGWLGADLAELYGSVLPEMYDSSLVGFDIGPMMRALMQPENMAQFMTIERLPNRVLVEQEMAVFQTTIDYAAMLDIPAFRDMLETVFEAEEEANVEEAMDAIRAMYEGMRLVIIQCIGVNDKLVHSTEVEMSWDLAAFAEMTGEEAAPQFAFNLLVAHQEFNNAAEVVAPEDATILPLEGLFPTSRPTS